MDVQFERLLQRQLSLEELKSHKEGALAGMLLFNRPRLSVQPVSQEHVDFILALEDSPLPESLQKASPKKKARKA